MSLELFWWFYHLEVARIEESAVLVASSSGEESEDPPLRYVGGG